jgi:hypothetical protein
MSDTSRENDMDRIRRERRKQGDRAAGIVVEFLQKLRPGGPWVLTAIIPDGVVTTRTASSTEQVGVRPRVQRALQSVLLGQPNPDGNAFEGSEDRYRRD